MEQVKISESYHKQINELLKENETLKQESIMQQFSEWLKYQDVKRVNNDNSGKTFKRFIDKFTTDNYSDIALIINNFERLNKNK